ncbi:MAG: quinone-dependent dihydroorotate dehydrogenase [Gammaproteobacteria bacterium]
MLMAFYSLLRNGLFCLEPETAHKITLSSLKWLVQMGLFKPISLASPITVMGIPFPNRIGLAAGMDKNGEYLTALAALGFGFLEIGTVTPHAQLGNPKPRLFRLPQAQALINRLGFNNRGVAYLIEQVQQSRFSGVLGINIGKNADTPLEKATEDYLFCLHQVYPYASYVTINISSPNTPGLRQLQSETYLNNLLNILKQAQQQLAQQHQKYVPLVVKISPDMSDEELTQLAQTLLKQQIDGVIATNTTLSREAVAHLPHGEETGGLSGKPLFSKSTAVIRQLRELLQDKIPIIAVGGIMNGDNAKEKIAAGASLVQVYTGLIYTGPHLIRQIYQALL